MCVIGIVGLSLTDSGPLSAWGVPHETLPVQSGAREGSGKPLGLVVSVCHCTIPLPP